MKKRTILLAVFVLGLAFILGCCTAAQDSKTPAENSSEHESESSDPASIVPERSADGSVTIENLVKAEAAKTLGRISFVSGEATADWSGSGLEMNVLSSGGAMIVGYRTTYEVVFSAAVDGEEIVRDVYKGTGEFTIPLSAGEHTVSIVKDSMISVNASDESFLTSVKFDGEFLRRPDDKGMLIEVVGDSIACGFGARGVFKDDEMSKTIECSARDSFASVVAYYADGDLSLISRGGIGLLQSQGEEGYTLFDLYPYVSPYHDHETEWGFERKADLVILEASTNDAEFSNEEWAEALRKTVSLIREKNGENVPIVWAGRLDKQYLAVEALKEETGDENLYAVQFSYGSSGGAGTSHSAAGHPNTEEQYVFGTVIMRYLSDHKLAEIKKQP